MGITIQTVLSKLDISYSAPSGISDHIYDTVIRNGIGANFFNDHIINIITGPEYASAVDHLSGAVFIVGDYCRKKEEVPGQDIVVFSSDTDIQVLMQTTHQIMDEYERFHDYLIHLRSLAENQSNLFKVLELFTSYYNNLVCMGDRSGNIWIGTNRHGLVKVNVNSLQMDSVKIKSMTSSRRLQRNTGVRSVYVDDSDLLWVGTSKSGVAYFGNNIYKFESTFLAN